MRFALAGDGRLLDNLGTSTGARVVQLYNGRAQLSAQLTGAKANVSVSSDGRKTVFRYVTNTTAAVISAPEKVTKPKTSSKSTKASATGNPAAGVVASVGATAKSGAPKLALDVAAIDHERIMKAATAGLQQQPVTITAFPAKLSEGGPNDFYSNGDYWWPDPSKPGGLPYIRRDGETNPENFS